MHVDVVDGTPLSDDATFIMLSILQAVAKLGKARKFQALQEAKEEQRLKRSV